ncbi:hypothetical protein TSMEX_003585 [Taenia solium]|eukprot:TsM_000253700 transcript=TsM_000253700 gene=TsM_000253700
MVMKGVSQAPSDITNAEVPIVFVCLSVCVCFCAYCPLLRSATIVIIPSILPLTYSVCL